MFRNARPYSVLSLLPAALALCTPMAAQSADEVEAWTPTETALKASAAGIALPQTVGGLSLSRSGEASNGGRGIDNYAQYLSEDGAVQATLYVYLPAYADASLAAYMTDKAVMDRFGPRTRRTAYASADAGGRKGVAIRAVYDDAADGALTTAAAFVHAGRWMVKLRITGPGERRREVLAGLDAMLADMRFDDPASLHAAAPAKIGACPATAANMKGGALPRDGQGDLCLRATIATAQGPMALIQQAGVEGGATIVPMDDTGTTLAFEPAADGKGYQLAIHSLGQTDIYGDYDAVPDVKRIAAIIDGSDPAIARARSTTAYAASGGASVDVAAMRDR